MKVISKAFEQELILTESNRNDVKRASEVLEKRFLSNSKLSC